MGVDAQTSHPLKQYNWGKPINMLVMSMARIEVILFMVLLFIISHSVTVKFL